ncbi:hypothetical protein ASD89_13175 [Caulobacter sp. Root656]|nr:hypothetical protein ASD89_13175 [Caulobacter sp. Root656]
MTPAKLPWRAAILSGLRLVAGRPAAALSWALVFAVGGTIMAGFQVWAWQAVDSGRGLTIVAVRLGLAGFALNIVMTTVTCAAILRATIHPEDRHAAWPRFGGVELRLLGLVLPLTLVWLLLSSAVGVLTYPLVAKHAGYPSVLPYTTGSTAVVLTLLGGRLALAAPMTVADRRLRLGSALTLSHGRHAGLAVILLAALLISMAIEGAGAWARDLLIGATGTTSPPVLKSPSLSAALNAAFGPAALAVRVLGAMVHALAVAVLVAPMGHAYRCLKGDSVDQVAVFD